jgi:excisionase family DNA binding protein
VNAADLAQDRLLVAEDVARILSVTTPYVYELARDGRIPSVRVGDSQRFVRFLREEVLAWARSTSSGARTREPLMDTEAVMLFLGLKDARTARDVMREAGAFEVRGRLRLAPPDLDLELTRCC